MMAGFDRYYQIVKCFRDEDLRADRQPEFTQIDIETSFLDEHEIRALMEGLVRTMFKEALGVELPEPVPGDDVRRRDARLRLGQARPARAAQADRAHRRHARRSTSRCSARAAELPNGRVAALRVPGGGTLTRKEIDDYTAFVDDLRRRGASPTSRSTTPPSRTRKACSRRSSSSSAGRCCATILERTGAQTGDLDLLRRRQGEGRQRRAGRAAREGRPRARLRRAGLEAAVGRRLPDVRVRRGDEALGRAAPPVHRAEGRPRGALRDRSRAARSPRPTTWC